jgi:hypothetical protein
MRHGPRDRERPGLVPAPGSRSGPACEIDERGAPMRVRMTLRHMDMCPPHLRGATFR